MWDMFMPRKNGNSSLGWFLSIIEHDVQDGHLISSDQAIHIFLSWYRDL